MYWFSSEPLLALGTPAPDFILNDERGEAVQLSASRGKNVILIFYPGDGTPVCRAQLTEFGDRWEEVRRHNAVLFGVNPASARSHESFRQKNCLPFPLLVDLGRKVASAYRAGGWMVKRTVYLIGPDGAVRFARRGKPSVDEVLAAAA